MGSIFFSGKSGAGKADERAENEKIQDFLPHHRMASRRGKIASERNGRVMKFSPEKCDVE